MISVTDLRSDAVFSSFTKVSADAKALADRSEDEEGQ